MALVDNSDIQVHLPTDKLDITEIPDDLDKVKVDVERIIRGYLAGVFTPATLAAWVSPSATPELIRAIGGRLAAALIYRTRYSEDTVDDPEFAQVKYADGMAMLNGIISGALTIEEITTDTATLLNPDFFWPNNSTADPKFTMDMEL